MRYFDFEVLNKKQRYVAVTTIVNDIRKTVIWTEEDREKTCRRIGEELSRFTDHQTIRQIRAFQRYLVNMPEIFYSEEHKAWEVSEQLLDILEFDEGKIVKIKTLAQSNEEDNWAYKNAIAELECVNGDAKK
ncbi:MAG: hypothetical protein ACLRZ9_02810 [Eubacterium sp.]